MDDGVQTAQHPDETIPDRFSTFLCSRRSSAAHGGLRFACSLSPKNISREQKECGMLLCIPTHLEQIFQLIQSLASLITIDLRGRALTSIAAFLTK